MGMDYRAMFDRDYLASWDLGGKDVIVTIKDVKPGELTGQGGRKVKKPVLHFEEKDKPFAISKTDGRTISSMYGKDVSAWIGKRITLYPTQTAFGNDTVDCIRVRPTPPTK